MISLLLFLIAISSFLFYGVAGQDKTWLLGPLFVSSYALISAALLKKASGAGQGGVLQAAGRKFPPATLLWMLFVLWGIAMVPRADVPFEAKLAMLFTGGVVGAYLVWGGELTTFKDNRTLLGLLVFMVMLAALYGLIIHFKCPEKVLWAERYTDSYEGRLRSTYICPNHFAHLLQMLLPFCLVLLFIPQAGLYLKMLAGYSFLVFLPPLFLTESRAGWLGAIAAVGVTVCLMAFRRSKKLFAVLVVLVPLCSALLLFGAWRFSETFQRRMEPVVEFLQGQAEGGIGSESRDFRPNTWMDTIAMVKEAPLIGFGPGNYRYSFPEHRSRFRGARIVTGHPHNEYLELIADFGLVGFGIFALAWICGLLRILAVSLKAEETRHAFPGFAFLGAAAGTMVHSFFDFQMHVYPNALVFAFLAAMAWGPLAAQRTKGIAGIGGRKKTSRGDNGGNGQSAVRDESAEGKAISGVRRLTFNVRRSAAWLLAVGYLVAAVFCVQIMSSSFIRAMGDKAAEMKNLEKTERMYRLALKIDSQNWRACKGMGNLLFNHRYYSLDMVEKVALASEERQWFEKAYALNPKDAELVLGYGKAMVFLGRSAGGGEPSPTGNGLRERGLELLREACRYRPFNDVYWLTLGIELRKAGLYEEALEVFRHTETIKRSRSARKNIAWLKARLETSGERRKALDAGSRPVAADSAPVAEPLPDPGSSGATADRELLDLLKRMDD